MKKTKLLTVALLLLLSVLSVVLLPAAAVLFAPPAYGNTFVGFLDEKVERLKTVEGEKAVVIGGSSVAFGLDSALMEEHLSMPVINFGLYAAIGTKAMLDLSRPYIGAGDIVILAPEINAETLSLYFNGANMWKAIDESPSLFFSLRGESKKQMLGAMYAHAVAKLSDSKAPLDPEGVYNSKSFNAYGDVVYPRENNVMPLYYDPNTPIVLDPSILSSDFASYLNDYIAYCQKQGATVYFSYSPMNAAAITEESTGESRYALEKALKNEILCEHISMIDSYIMDAEYFYDTNFHLNDAGVRLRTKTLIDDIRIAQGIFTAADIELLPKPELPLLDVHYPETDENDRYFLYEKMENGALAIVGLTALGKEQTELTLPLGAEYKKVTGLAPNAFAQGKATHVTVPENSNLRSIATGAFDGSAVETLYILYDFTDEAEKLSPPSSFGGVEVYVPAGSAYLSHYDWSRGYKLNLLP